MYLACVHGWQNIQINAITMVIITATFEKESKQTIENKEC